MLFSFASNSTDMNKNTKGKKPYYKKPAHEGIAANEMQSLSKRAEIVTLVVDYATAAKLSDWANKNNDNKLAAYITKKAQWSLDKKPLN
jgi:hypothetical protein